MSSAAPKIIPIQGVIKNYPWGSLTTLAQHRGESQSELPEAELWFGDNPNGPSPIVNKDSTLAEITSDSGRLPFLAKILAVEHSLSLQVHPALADIPSLKDVLQDDNHKPEMVVALTEFHALVGIASVDSILELCDRLASEKVNELISKPLRSGITVIELLDQILGVEDSSGVLEEVLIKLVNLDQNRERWMRELIGLYRPKLDPLALLLCELVILKPGNSIYLPPRCIHAYLNGTVVEVMANSDNVIRGGLTNKPIDKRNFLKVIDTRGAQAEAIQPFEDNGLLHWRPPIDDFTLMRWEGAFSGTISVGDRAIAFTSQGSAVISPQESAVHQVVVSQNHGAYLAPGEYLVEGSGSLWVVSGKGR